MQREAITFKGVSQGIYLEINCSDIGEIKKELDKKIKSSPGFFQGTKFLYIKSEDLSPKEILELELILKYKYDFQISLEDMDFSSIDLVKEEKSIDSDEELTRFVYKTLRSGQEVEYNGNIIVIGDVNPGAMLKASGNIIVLGSLRGVAYAGLNGNKDAIVAAYHLMPTQLRIGDLIVRAPDGDSSSAKVPEVAKIYNDEVIIEPYLPNK